MPDELSKKAEDVIESVKNVKRIPVKWAWLIIVVVVVVFSFYWFSVRPAQILKKCYKEQTQGGRHYEACLRLNGINS